MLIESLLTSFGGAVAALSLAGFIFRSFIKLQTDKVLTEHSHALTVEKERLAHELALRFHQKTIGISRYEQDRIEALKSIFEVVQNLNRAFLKLRSLSDINKQKDFNSEYFLALSRIFGHLSTTFDEIAEAYLILDFKSVYLEDATEKSLKQVLDATHAYYTRALARYNQILASMQQVDTAVSGTTQPVDLIVIASEIANEWVLIIEPGKKTLKDTMRIALSAT